MPSWDEPKRRRNLRLHGLDFRGVEPIWEHFTVTREDTREPYGELRKAEKYETRYYLEASQKHQPGGC